MWHDFTKSKGPFLHFFKVICKYLGISMKSLQILFHTVTISSLCYQFLPCFHVMCMSESFSPMGLRVVTSSIICSPEWLWFLFRHLISSISRELSIVWGMHLNDSDTYATLQRQKVDKAQFLLALKKPTKPKTWQYLTPRLTLMALHKKFMGAVEFNGPFSSIQRLSWLRCVRGSH